MRKSGRKNNSTKDADPVVIYKIINTGLGNKAYETQKNDKTADIDCTIIHNDIPR